MDIIESYRSMVVGPPEPGADTGADAAARSGAVSA